MSIRRVTPLLLTIALLAAACSSAAADPEVAGSTQVAAPTTTSTTTTTEAPRTTEPQQPLGTTPIPHAAELEVIREMHARLSEHDPTFVEFLTPELRDAEVWPGAGFTLPQFNMFFQHDNSELLMGACEWQDDIDSMECMVLVTDDFLRGLGFTGESIITYGFEDGLISAWTSDWNGGAATGGFWAWLPQAYPDERACDVVILGIPIPELPPGALEWPEGVPLGKACRDVMVKHAAEYSESEFFLGPSPLLTG